MTDLRLRELACTCLYLKLGRFKFPCLCACHLSLEARTESFSIRAEILFTLDAFHIVT